MDLLTRVPNVKLYTKVLTSHCTMQGYPGLTPFDGLASGVVALVRHLPAGSPAIFYAIHSLVVKANKLCDKSSQDSVYQNCPEESESGKKIVDLLIRLIFVVDIQVNCTSRFIHSDFIFTYAEICKLMPLHRCYFTGIT